MEIIPLRNQFTFEKVLSSYILKSTGKKCAFILRYLTSFGPEHKISQIIHRSIEI